MAKRKIFFSYSSDDRAFADELRHAVTTGRDVQVWDAASTVTPGHASDELISENLSSSDLFVYIVPEREGAGKLSLIELGAAKALGKRIVAVLPNSARVANSAVAAKLADTLVVNQDRGSTQDIATTILEKAA